MMKRTLVVLALPWILLGCNASSDHVTSSQRSAIRCAENWRRQGFTFDPNSMTSSQMFERAQAIRRAAYWREKGYFFDPCSMPVPDMDSKVEDINRAAQWKEQGYNFDPNTMTAREMDRIVDEASEARHWASLGYYYDPNTSEVYLSRQSRTKLSSLPSPSAGKYAPVYSLQPSYTTTLSGASRYSQSRSHPTSDRSLLDKPALGDNPTHTPQSSTRLRGPQAFASGPSVYPGGLGHETNRGTYLGQLSANRFTTDSTSNPFGAGSRFNPDGVNNRLGTYGSELSPYSVRNPFATDAPKLFDSQGNYRGKLSSNPFDPDSISNPFGRYGSRFSPDSINNPFGAGNPFSPDSPTNPFGRGLSIYGEK
jgi:hypothetical protein